ncbi:MAG: methyltransferase domain-containing protein [Melioribacteraceae bacterium]|nr:methyltransferase domain-containing protein [Saprospiraceae bacterium]MCF8356402.1 methyltransferase domain-containing protein [Melioribacteraceae bacterium]MCF8394765.1 methyltransferase domain-containing protein [Melioribacteraceae bacterium]
MHDTFTKFKNRQKINIISENNYKTAEEIYCGNEYHDYFRRIPFIRIKYLLEINNIHLNGATLHIASCGTGIDVYYLKKLLNFKGDITVSDFAEKAVEQTIHIFPDIHGKVEDNEKLSFSDNYFDYTYIAAALHHLPRPNVGLYELLRVSKYGIIVKEPNDSWLTRLATKFGFAQEVEKSGNYVYRYSRREIQKIANSLFYEYKVERYFATHRVAKSKVEFIILKGINIILNVICPQFGNQILFLILKKNS